MNIPEGYADLFDDASTAFLALATIRASGEPVVAPVWFVSDDRGLLFTSEDHSLKARDMRARPQIAGIVMVEGEHKRYVSVRGDVEEIDARAEGIDPVQLHRRIWLRYETEESDEPFVDPIFRLLPRRMTGYDYRDFGA